MALSRRSVFIFVAAVSAGVVFIFNIGVLVPVPTKPGKIAFGEIPQSKVGTDLCAAFSSFKQDQHGEVLCKGHPQFTNAISIFNLKHSRSHIPALAVQPYNSQGVSEALRLAKQWGLQVTIKNGGHNPAGLARHRGALLIDMAKMKSIQIDEEGGVITAEGGAVWNEVQDVVKDSNISFVGGGCPTVGVVGLFLGGGIGWLSRSRGLASDNVLEMEIVLANGTITVTSHKRHPELFWGLLGAGGSNFGVVTRAKFSVFPSEPEYFAGHLCLHSDKPTVWNAIVSAWLDGVDELKDNGLSSWMVISRTFALRKDTPQSQVNIRYCIYIFHDGPAADGAQASSPILNRIGDVVEEHPDTLCRNDKHAACRSDIRNLEPGQMAREYIVGGKPFLQKHTFISWSRSMGIDHIHIDWRSGFIHDTKPGFVKKAMEAMLQETKLKEDPENDRGKMASFQFQVEHLGGRIQELDHGCYSHRSAKLLWSIQGIFLSKNHPSQTTEGEIEKWAASAYFMLEPFFKGSYSNYADASFEGKDWSKKYFGETYKRLQVLKGEVGGFSVFNTRQRIEKSSEAL